MKKIIYPIIGAALFLVTYIAWQGTTHSQGEPYPNPANQEKLTACEQSVSNEIYFMQNDWSKNLADILDQEKPTSEVVDEAYESMRTYRCWLEYTCEAVLVSSNAKHFDGAAADDPRESTWPMAISLESLPGCQDADDLEIPSTEIKFMKYCAPRTPHSPDLGQVDYQACQRMINKEKSTVKVGMDKSLKLKSYEQKNVAMQNKLVSILNKMHAMEAHLNSLNQYITQLDKRLPCYASTCD